MQRIHVERQDAVAIITMNDGKANVLNKEFFDQMQSVLVELEADDSVGAVLLTGHSKFFSAGLDLKTLPALAKDELLPILIQFSEMTLQMFNFPKPLIAAVNGHALAGGCVLLLCCDRRFVTAEGAKIGLNEIGIGLALPTFVSELALSSLGPAGLQEAVMEATVYAPEGALRVGYAHTLCSSELLLEEAGAAAAKMSRLPTTAYGTTKRRIRAAAIQRAEQARGGEIQDFLSSGPFA
jgi:enoyl-CoA hydratase